MATGTARAYTTPTQGGFSSGNTVDVNLAGLADWVGRHAEAGGVMDSTVTYHLELEDATLSQPAPPRPDLVSWYRTQLDQKEQEISWRVLQARRRKFGGRKFLLWAEDVPERCEVALWSHDEGTGARGCLLLRDEELREAYLHFAQCRVEGIVSDLGLGPDGDTMEVQPPLSTESIFWPSNRSEPLVVDLLTRLLDAVYFEVNAFGDEWSMRLPGLGPRPRGELSGQGMGPVLQLAVGMDAPPGYVPGPVTPKNGSGSLPPSSWHQGSQEWPDWHSSSTTSVMLQSDGHGSPAPSGKPQQQPPLTPPPRWCRRSSEPHTSPAPASGGVRGDLTQPLATRLNSALSSLRCAEEGAGGLTPGTHGREKRATLPGLWGRSRPAWRPAPKKSECLGGLHSLAESTLTSPPPPRGGRHHGRRPRSASAAWARWSAPQDSAAPAGAGAKPRAEAAPGKAGVASGQGDAAIWPCSPPTPPQGGRPHFRHSLREPQVLNTPK